MFNSKTVNRRDVDKTLVGKKIDEPKISQVLDLLKKMNPTTFNAHKPNTGEKAPVHNNVNRQPRVQNYPYTTQWKDGRPITNPTQNDKDKNTLDPLQKSSVNMNDDVPWCIICQSPHSLEYCAISLSFVSDHSVQNEEEEAEKSHDDISCNMVSMCSDSMDSDLEETKNDLEDKRVSY